MQGERLNEMHTCVQLTKLMVQTNIGEDYSIDPIVHEACDSVVRSGCSNVRSGQRRCVLCMSTHCQ